MNELRDAVQILVDRMKTHPEDFFQGGRFSWFVVLLQKEAPDLLDTLTPAELEAVKQGVRSVSYARLHSQVLSSLLEDHELPSMQIQGSSLKPYTVNTINAGKVVGVGAITSAHTTHENTNNRF